ncbi:hypothetical protein GCM10027589_01360 [Actinocorallia lasiicapitis]
MTYNRLTRLLSLLVASVFALCLVQIVASPAQAYSCSKSTTRTVTHRNGGVAKATITFQAQCSDGKTHWDGVLTDILCDGRAARLTLMSDWTPIPGSPGFEWGTTNGNGCNTSSSFGGSSTNPTAPGADLWLGACNTWTCATWDRWDLLYF